MPEAPFANDRPILLVGMMGAGKTTVGRLLAERLGFAFVDADDEVVDATGLGVGAIFEHHGEARFRDEERRAMARLASGPPRIIAAGGGAFDDAETRALALQQCLVIWLDADLETVVARLAGCGTRPLLRGKDVRSALSSLWARRRAAYAEAHLHVRSRGSPEATAEAIIAELAEPTR